LPLKDTTEIIGRVAKALAMQGKPEEGHWVVSLKKIFKVFARGGAY